MAQANQDALAFAQTQLNENKESFVTLRQEHEDAKVARERAESDLRNAQKGLDDQKKHVESIELLMTDKFASLSRDALAGNSTVFLDRAKAELAKVLESVKGDVNLKHKAIDDLIDPLKVELKRLQEHTQNLEKERHGAYVSLMDQVRELRLETGSLSQALRSPKARGRWGELTLKRVVELAGLVEHCDFHEQVHVTDEERLLIPDMTVHLPDGKTVVVDAKVPIVAYQDAVNSPSDEERQSHLKRHAAHVRKHVKDLSGQTYWSQFEKSPDFVVMFIPGEAYFAAAVEIESNLIEDAIQSGVLISSPIMLVALLRTIAMSWRQSQLEENAKRISELGRELHDRIAIFVEHFEKVGANLGQSVKFYNEATSSLESRVIVQARRFRELGITPKKEILELTQIERTPKVIQSEILTDSTNGA